MKISKNVLDESWAPKLIFSNEKKIGKIPRIFDIEKWLWMSEFCYLVGLIISTENDQKKNFNAIFGISEVLEPFWKILLTWSKTYLGQEFMDGIKTGDKPNWIIRCQLFVKARGVLQDKRYLIQYRKD